MLHSQTKIWVKILNNKGVMGTQSFKDYKDTRWQA